MKKILFLIIFFSVPMHAWQEGQKTPAYLGKNIPVRHQRIQTERTTISAIKCFTAETMKRAADCIPERMVIPLILTSSVSLFLILGYMLSAKDAPLPC